LSYFMFFVGGGGGFNEKCTRLNFFKILQQ
jgi:hypothetical protein